MAKRRHEIAPEDAARGLRFKEARERDGRYTQAELAEKVGTTQQTIGRIESGETPRSQFFVAISQELGVDYDQLVTGETKKRVNIQIGAADLPVFACVEGEGEPMDILADIVTKVHRPAELQYVTDAYGVVMADSTMSPFIKPGDTVIVNPKYPLNPNNLVLLRTAESGGQALVRYLIGHTKTAWRVRPASPAVEEVTLKRSEWPICHKVVSINFA